MTKSFQNTGESFSGWQAALDWCRENGYSYGPMQAGSPTGIAKGEVSIAKWRNIPSEDYHLLSGTIEGDFRDGTVTVKIGPVE